MARSVLSTPSAAASQQATGTAFAILAAISFCHLLNDMMQSLLPAIYPILKDNYGLTFGQIGFMTFTFQVTASLLQPVIGFVTDRRPQPYSLAVGMGFLLGLLLLSLRRRLSMAARGCGYGWHGVGGVAPGVVAHRASGGREEPRARTVVVPDGWQPRLLDRAVVRGRGRAALRPGSVAWFALAAVLRMALLVVRAVAALRHGANARTSARPESRCRRR
jgi:FSR family fosmidomycin resistance protein-like MFS transporter